MHRKLALERSSKPTKYELQGPYGDPVYEPPGTRWERNNYLGTSGNQFVFLLFASFRVCVCVCVFFVIFLLLLTGLLTTILRHFGPSGVSGTSSQHQFHLV